MISLLTGLYARELAGLVHHTQPEEAFICGMMCELGRLAVAFEQPDRYRAVQHAVASEGLSESAAARAALEGLDFSEIGRALALRWNLPRQVHASIGLTDDVLGATPSADPLAIAILCARELAAIVTVRGEH